MSAQFTIANISIRIDYHHKLARFYKALMCSILVSGVAACSNDDIKPLHMSNPASDYCLKNNGTIETIEHINGDVSLCTLPDGEVIEEWELFRRDHQKS